MNPRDFYINFIWECDGAIPGTGRERSRLKKPKLFHSSISAILWSRPINKTGLLHTRSAQLDCFKASEQSRWLIVFSAQCILEFLSQVSMIQLENSQLNCSLTRNVEFFARHRSQAGGIQRTTRLQPCTIHKKRTSVTSNAYMSKEDMEFSLDWIDKTAMRVGLSSAKTPSRAIGLAAPTTRSVL